MNLLLEHLAIVPIVLPLAAGALMLLVDDRRYVFKGVVGVGSAILLVAAAMLLLHTADAPSIAVYPLGNWPAPYGIVLVADRLSALMVLLTSVLGLCALVFALARWHRAGPRFHSLLQFLLMGVNGAFLTGDLFNLFVFFEVLLAASYGLALHGGGPARVGNSLHYLAINLTGSLLFLIGAAVLYGLVGTLNMADLAARFAAVEAGDRALLEAGAAVLGLAFLIKAAMWPLGFWLPGVYASASSPASALFAILTKVGIYVVLRLWFMFFGDGESAGFGAQVLIGGGILTLVFGSVGALAAQDMPRLASFSLLVSAGTLLAMIGVADATTTAAALYYLVVSTLGVSAFFLLIELIERGRGPAADVLSVTAEAFGAEAVAETEDEVGVPIPGTMTLLALCFVGCGLLLASMPPMPGFIAKFALFAALLAPDSIPTIAWVLIALLTVSGIALLVAYARAGIRAFWASQDRAIPNVRVIEFAPVALLLLICIALTIAAEPAMRYLDQTAQALHAPAAYIESVLPR